MTKRKTTRRGRWTYDSTTTYYGAAGWHLDGTPIVIDFMPGYIDCEPSRGMYLLYNWPGKIDGEPIATQVDRAMEIIEDDWDKACVAASINDIRSALGA